MKLTWFLFSIYVVSLSLLPCNDIDICGSFAKTGLHKNHSQDKNTDPHDDLCAPFCSCTCCGVHGFQFQNHIFKKEKTINCTDSGEQNDFYIFNNYKTIYLGIWQPPKLS